MTAVLTTAAHYRDAHREIYADVGELGARLDASSAMLPTGCPGWTVRDCIAHIAALEGLLSGRSQPEHQAPEGLAHVRSDFGAFMENGVDARRSWPIDELLDEYRDVTTARLAWLGGVDDADLDGEAQGIFGMSKLRPLLSIRVFDMWSHEQDMRRALGTPGGLVGLAGAHSRERMAMGIANRLQETLTPPAGTTLALDVTGPGGAQRAVTFTGDRGRAGDDIPAAPTVTMHLDLPTLTVLACGRSDDAGARSRVVVEGDQNLAGRMLDRLAFTP